MTGLLVATLLLAAPRTDGVYVDESSFAFLSAPAVSEAELSFIEYARFTKDKLIVQYLLEALTHRWRSRNGHLEVDLAGEWAERVWRELPGEVIEADVLHEGTVDRLRFVKGSFDERKRTAGRAFTTAQLARLAGRYGEGRDAVTIDAKSKLVASQCFVGCTTFATVCLESKGQLLLETDEGLVRLPGVEGLCGGYRSGVEPKNGVLLARKTAIAPAPEGKVEATQLLAALDARAAGLATCNETQAPRRLKLSVTIGRSGFLTAVDTGEPALDQCLGDLLSRLAFPTQNANTTISAEWNLPVRLRR